MGILAGQWIAPYTGTNTGLLVIELDDIGDHYEGTACAWDNDAESINSLVFFRTPSKDSAQRLRNVPVVPMDHAGNALLHDAMETLKSTKGIHFPETADIDLALDGLNLAVHWKTPIGTAGGGVATAPKTESRLPSDLRPLPVTTWDEFKQHVNALCGIFFVARKTTHGDCVQVFTEIDARHSIDMLTMTYMNYIER